MLSNTKWAGGVRFPGKIVTKVYGSMTMLLALRGGAWVSNFQQKKCVTIEWPLTYFLTYLLTPGKEHALEQEVCVVGVKDFDEGVIHVEGFDGHPQPGRQEEVMQCASKHLQRRTLELPDVE